MLYTERKTKNMSESKEQFNPENKERIIEAREHLKMAKKRLVTAMDEFIIANDKYGAIIEGKSEDDRQKTQEQFEKRGIHVGDIIKYEQGHGSEWYSSEGRVIGFTPLTGQRNKSLPQVIVREVEDEFLKHEENIGDDFYSRYNHDEFPDFTPKRIEEKNIILPKKNEK